MTAKQVERPSPEKFRSSHCNEDLPLTYVSLGAVLGKLRAAGNQRF